MKVSIIIPAYNEEEYVGRCIETILEQTHKDFELIFVDDGSKDRTKDIIGKFMKKDKRVKLLTQQHGGPGRGRNLGAKHSRGDILIFVDADMEFDKNYVRNLIKPIAEGKAIGTYHIKELVANKDNIWARCWGTKRVDDNPGMQRPIFRAILKKEFVRVKGFDPKAGTFDDQSLAKKLGKLSIGVNAVCYHNNPTTLSETYHHTKWIGGSFITAPQQIVDNLRKFLLFAVIFVLAVIAGLYYILVNFSFVYFILTIVLLPIALSVLLTIKRLAKEKKIIFLFVLPVYYFVMIFGFLIGMIKQMFFALVSKSKRREVSYKY